MIRFAQENKRFCKQLGIEFIDCDYDSDNWYGKSFCFIRFAEKTYIMLRRHAHNHIISSLSSPSTQLE